MHFGFVTILSPPFGDLGRQPQRELSYGAAYAVGSPPTNLQAGGCRFGHDPKASVLDPDCRAHECENLVVTDGSFMPTGGSVPHTWTIYANALRVADRMAGQLGCLERASSRLAAASTRL